MKEKIIKLAAGAIGISGLVYTPKANAETWEIFLCNKFNNSATGENLTDNFFAGVDDFSSDGYTLGDDILNPPSVPGDYSDLNTLVDGNRLMVDRRSLIPFPSSKTWNIDLILGNQTFIPMSGINTIVSDISQVPFNYNVSLTDYGTDASRTNPLNIADLRATPDYQFPLSGLGVVRYLALTIENVPEPSGLVGLLGLGGVLLKRQRRNNDLAREYKKVAGVSGA